MTEAVATMAPPGRSETRWRDALLVFILAFVPLLWALGGSPLARTEPHRAIPAHAMVATGDWLVPRLYGVPYLRKPPLHYWLLALAERCSGSTSEFVYRLPSALAGGLVCMAVCIAAGRWFGRVAGIASGMACLAVIPLWGQWRSADVDATNTLFGVVAALAALEIGRRRAVAVAWPAALLAASAAAGTLVKGPACWPTILGGAVGAAWLAHGARRRTVAWIGVACGLGTLVFAAWALMALRALQQQGMVDWSGVAEAVGRAGGEGGTWLVRLLMPAILFAYGPPTAFAVLLAPRREFATALGAEAARLVRALAIAWLASAVVGIAGGVNNPRYAFMTLPLLAPIVGATVATWRAGAWSRTMQGLIRAVLTIAAAIYAGAGIVLVIAERREGAGASAMTPATAATVGVVAAIAIIGAATIVLWVRERSRWAAIGTVALLVVFALPFTAARNRTRREVAAVAAAQQLRDIVGERARVVSGMWVMTSPELFRYADVDVDYRPGSIDESTPLESGAWVVFQREEWEALSPERRASFDDVTPLDVKAQNALLARFRGAPSAGSPTVGR